MAETMDFDEIVETSDAEEQQELEAKELEMSRLRIKNINVSPLPHTPARKRTKFLHEPNVEERVSTVSPIKSESTGVNTPQRSRSSSTMFANNTSPQPLFSSRSPTRSPGQAYDVLSLPKMEEEEVSMDLHSVHIAGSQDPLIHSPALPSHNSLFSSLAASPVNGTPLLTIPQTTTPINSPTRQTFDLMSPPLQFPYSPPPESPMRQAAKSLQGEVRVDELLLFTPTKASSQQHSSPLTPASAPSPGQASVRDITPERSRSRSLSQSSTKSASPGPSPPPAIVGPENQEDASIALAQELNGGSRYALRARNPRQERPYLADLISYQKQLAGIPEAIVKNKALEHHRHRHHPDDHYEELETQPDSYIPDDNADDDAWEGDRRRKRRREEHEQDTTTERDVAHYPGILQGPPESDEEEDRQMDSVTKEARRLIKKLEKEKKAQERKEREQKAQEEILKAKRFPVPKRIFVTPKFSKQKPPTLLPGDNEQEGEGTWHVSQARDDSPAPRQPSRRPSSPPAAAAMRDYFAHEDELEMPNYDDSYHHNDPSNHDDPSGWNENPSVDQRDSVSPHPVGILRNTYETAIHVDSDQDAPSGTRKNRSQSSGTDTGIQYELGRKKESALKKMYPKSMIGIMFKDPNALDMSKPKPHRPQEKPKIHDEDGRLIPGKTRAHAAANPKDIKDIKGDTESEIEIESDQSSLGEMSEGDSSSDANGILSLYSRHTMKVEKPDVIDLTKTQYSDTEEAGPSRPSYFHRHKATRRKARSGRLHDPYPIDYMLSRSNNSERNDTKSAEHRGTSHHRQSKFKHDIVTVDGKKYGRERQTVLNFQTGNSSQGRGHQGHRKRRKPSGSKQPWVSDEEDTLPDDWEADAPDHTPDIQIPVMMSDWKQKAKEKGKMRRKKKQFSGLYVINHGDQKISSGKHPGRLYTSVIPGYNALTTKLQPPKSRVPSKRCWSERYVPPSPIERIQKPQSRSSSIVPENSDVGALSHNKLTKIPSDLDVPILQPGKSFGASTHIKKGWLYQLTNIGTVQQPPLPSNILGFELGPDMGVDQFCALLPVIGEGLLEFAIGLPDPDFEVLRAQWSLLMRSVSCHTSWYLQSAGTEDALALRATLEKEVLRLVGQIDQTALTFIDTPVMAVSWFLVDLSTRLRYQYLPTTTMGNAEKTLRASTSSLMRLLLQFGVKKTMQLLLDDVELDGSSATLYSVELWVSLIHILGMSANTDSENKPQTHRFWLLLTDALSDRLEILNTRTPYEASEDVWRTIMSACTLSQFSVHGMTLSRSHLPAYWNIAVFALKTINLGGEIPRNDERGRGRKMVDKYVALVVVRCDHLRDRYQWSLANAPELFNSLAAIFRVRKFANLLHEANRYSNFFYDTNWDLLSFRQPEDTAFTIFLKFIVQAAKEDELHMAGELSLQLRKILSLAIPMGSLSLEEQTKPQHNDLSKFYNRIVALAVVGDLDRNSIDERIQKARGYIDFSKAHYRLRVAVIRGIEKWAILLVDRDMSIRSFAPWIDGIVQILDADIKECTEFKDSGVKDSPKAKDLSDLAHLLVFSAGLITEACTKHFRYPYVFILENLRPLVLNRKLNTGKGSISEKFMQLVNALFDARSAALPLPPRPPLRPQLLSTADEESQESQDFGFTDDWADMDWGADDLPAVLMDPAKSVGRGIYDSDDSFRTVLKTSHMQKVKWEAFQGLAPYLREDTKGTKSCDLWLRSYLGFCVVEGEPRAWTSSLGFIDSELRKIQNEHWVRRVQVSIMFQVLKLDPMLYLTYTERAFGVFLNSLVSDANIVDPGGSNDNTVEREYISWLLSIDDLQHPLLSEVPVPPRNEVSGDYEFKADEFLNLRIPLLQAIFKNLEKHISLQLGGARPEVPLDTVKYVALCRSMFSGMRNNLLRLTTDPPSDKFKKYREFCLQAARALQGNQELCQRLSFWAGWDP